jgi:hypothetical protein
MTSESNRHRSADNAMTVASLPHRSGRDNHPRGIHVAIRPDFPFPASCSAGTALF